MVAFRAFDAPTDLRTGYFLLDVPEPATAAQGAVAVAALLAKRHCTQAWRRCRVIVSCPPFLSPQSR